MAELEEILEYLKEREHKIITRSHIKKHFNINPADVGNLLDKLTKGGYLIFKKDVSARRKKNTLYEIDTEKIEDYFDRKNTINLNSV